jgi:hypothetical protein
MVKRQDDRLYYLENKNNEFKLVDAVKEASNIQWSVKDNCYEVDG